MIPKIIHQTWKDNNVPQDLAEYVDKVKKLNPDWEYILWTDDKMLDFVKNEFPDFLATYNGFPKNIMRADSFRYLLMYRLGGVYLDLDYEVLAPFDFGNEKVVLPYNRQLKNGDKYDGMGNCFFASEPNHPFWKDVIESMQAGLDPETEKQHPRSTLEEETTGPAFLSRVFQQKDYSDIHTPDRNVYHPPTPRSLKEQQQIENNGTSLGIHHCAGSWRDKGLLKSLQKMIKKIGG